MGDSQLVEVQAECYRLLKTNQELSNILRELMQMAGADNVQKLAEFIQNNKTATQAPEVGE